MPYNKELPHADYPLRWESEFAYRIGRDSGDENYQKDFFQSAINPDLETAIDGVPSLPFASMGFYNPPSGDSALFPETYNNTSGFTFKEISYREVVYHAHRRPLSYSGSSNIWNSDLHLVQKHGIVVKNSSTGATVTPAGIDYEKGEIDLGVSTGSYDFTGYFTKITCYTYDGTYRKTFVSHADTYFLYPVYDPYFEYWASASDLIYWTKSGMVSRQASAIQGEYMCRLNAASGATSYVLQTITLPSASSQVMFSAVVRTDNYVAVEVSMDSGTTWAKEELPISLVPSADGLWCMLYVNSYVNSTTTPMIRISATGSGGAACQADIAYCMLVQGGL